MNTIMGTPLPDGAGFNNEVELQKLFQILESERSYLHQRWEDYAGWTLPHVFPMEEAGTQTEMQHDYQSVGAQAANHLTNKIIHTLFAPARPFFRITLTEDQEAELDAAGIKPTEIEQMLSMSEKRAMESMDKIKLRTALIQAMKSLIITGNTLLYVPENGDAAQVYNMRDLVVLRDSSGTALHIITRDRKSFKSLTPELQELVTANASARKMNMYEDSVYIYTGISLESDGKYYVKQEIDDTLIIPGVFGVYQADSLPWLPLTWNLARGHNYGTGLVEDFAGDFHTLSTLSEAVRNISAIAADIKILVNPMGQTDVKTLNNSPAGTYVHGVLDDVAYFQLEKFADLQHIRAQSDEITRRIGAAFLLNSQVTRQAERVTAEEIRMQANELEGSLGGVYSRLGEALQRPVAKMLLKDLDPAFAAIQPTILTGVESLGRNSELEQLLLFIQDLALLEQIPEELRKYIKLEEAMKLIGSHRQVEYSKFLRTDDEVQEADKRAAAMRAREAMGESLGQATGAAMAPPAQKPQ